jgi:hypothetical protein
MVFSLLVIDQQWRIRCETFSFVVANQIEWIIDTMLHAPSPSTTSNTHHQHTKTAVITAETFSARSIGLMLSRVTVCSHIESLQTLHNTPRTRYLHE